MVKQHFKKQAGEKIYIGTKSKGSTVNMEDITHITCDGYVCTIYFINKKPYYETHLLKHYEEALKEYGFFRANRHALINIEYHY